MAGLTSSVTPWSGTRTRTQRAPEMLGVTDLAPSKDTATATFPPGPTKTPYRRPPTHLSGREQPRGPRTRAARTYPRRPGSSRPPRGAPCRTPSGSPPRARPHSAAAPAPAIWAGLRGLGGPTGATSARPRDHGSCSSAAVAPGTPCTDPSRWCSRPAPGPLLAWDAQLGFLPEPALSPVLGRRTKAARLSEPPGGNEEPVT